MSPRSRNVDSFDENDDPDDADGKDAASESDGANESAAAARTYPFLNIVAEHGGVLLGTEDRKVVRPMTQDDLMDAAEEQAKVAHQMEEAEIRQERMIGEEKHYKKLLDGARENIRKAEKDQKECGQQLKAIAFEIETRTRTVPTKVNLTITPGNEVIEVDAETGHMLGRRTATADEVARSRNKSQALFFHPPAGTSDGGAPKESPEEKVVVLSISAAGQSKAKKSIREGLAEVPYPGQEGAGADAECLTIHWSASCPIAGKEESGRMYASVPTWAARRLRVVAEGTDKLDLTELSAG